MDISGKALLILLLIACNGFFVAAEYALVTVRRTRIDELVNKKKNRAKLVQLAQENIDRYISATQLGITIVSLAVGWLGEPIFAAFFENNLQFLPHTLGFLSAHALGILFSFLIITFFHVVIGELVPKSIALQRSEQIALFTILPLSIFTKIFSPVIWFLNRTARFFLKFFGLTAFISEPLHSEEEVRMILTESGEGGAIPEEEVEMVENVFELGDTPVVKIMIPKGKIVAFSETAHIKDVLARVVVSNRSRYPVYRDTIDTITGFVHIKDIYKTHLENQDRTLKEANIIRRIISVAEDKQADDVLTAMQKYHVHMAVVVTSEKKTVGIITLEDIIEGVVGEIEDEFEPKTSH